MTETKWFERLAPGLYAPILRCAECSDYIFPAPKLFTYWEQRPPAKEVAVMAVEPEARWVHIATLKEDCSVLIRRARPRAEQK